MTEPSYRSAGHAPAAGGAGGAMDVESAQAELTARNRWTPCRDDPAGWDIDRSGVLALWAAVRACRMECPLFVACRVVAMSGQVQVRSMVWAGVVYDERGARVDLNRPRLRIGPYVSSDTRLPNDAGQLFNGHTGRWETAPEQARSPGP